ncbi:MAG: imidazole glycerol phosphate synthase subunit HisH [Bdellovibrionota bacterium]
MTNTISIIDYGMGNIQSVVHALSVLNLAHNVVSDPSSISDSSGFILPGVGSFGEAMKNLNNRNLVKALTDEVVNKKKPLLGICLGMQLLAEESEENGLHTGLGWIKGKVKKMPANENLRIPHVGWSPVKPDSRNILFQNINSEASFYFDHSYHLICEDESASGTFDYGGKYVASIQKDNLYATQFHPEKSQNNGLRILRNFSNAIMERGEKNA